MQLQDLIALRDAAKAAYLKSLEALSYQVGDGGASRQLQRNQSDQLKAEFLDWDRRVEAAQSPAAARPRRRVYSLGPAR